MQQRRQHGAGSCVSELASRWLCVLCVLWVTLIGVCCNRTPEFWQHTTPSSCRFVAAAVSLLVWCEWRALCVLVLCGLVLVRPQSAAGWLQACRRRHMRCIDCVRERVFSSSLVCLV